MLLRRPFRMIAYGAYKHPESRIRKGRLFVIVDEDLCLNQVQTGVFVALVRGGSPP